MQKTRELYGIKASAVALFEAMPSECTFDELIQKGEQQERSAECVVEHLQAYERFEMVGYLPSGVIRKTGRKPYV